MIMSFGVGDSAHVSLLLFTHSYVGVSKHSKW